MNIYRTFSDLIELFPDQKNPNFSQLFSSLLNQYTRPNSLISQENLDPILATMIPEDPKKPSTEKAFPELSLDQAKSEPSILNLIKGLNEYRKTLNKDFGPQLEINLEGPPKFSGGFADVYISTYNGSKVAVKLSKPSRLENDQKLVTRELKRCKQLKYPYIAEYLGYTLIKSSESSQGSLGIVTKYYESGSLSHLIKRNFLTYTQKLNICINLSKAIEFIHIHRLCHFDVKPGNILIDEQLNPRLSDLGTCQKPKSSYKNSLAYTLGYAPPEQMRGKPVKESDVWNFGMTVYAVFAGQSPFREIKLDKEKFCKQVLIQTLEESNLPDLQVLNEDIVEIVKMCCRVKPGDRARLKDVRGKLNEVLDKCCGLNENNEMIAEFQHL